MAQSAPFRPPIHGVAAVAAIDLILKTALWAEIAGER
jgi:hypothetical protein